jgi:hypothetical protein
MASPISDFVLVADTWRKGLLRVGLGKRLGTVRAARHL